MRAVAAVERGESVVYVLRKLLTEPEENDKDRMNLLRTLASEQSPISDSSIRR